MTKLSKLGITHGREKTLHEQDVENFRKDWDEILSLAKRTGMIGQYVSRVSIGQLKREMEDMLQ